MKKRLFVDGHILTGIPQGTVTYLKGLYQSIAKMDDFELYFAVDDIYKADEVLNIANVNFVKYKSKNKFYRLGVDTPLLIDKYKCSLSHFQYIVPFFKTTFQIVTIHDILFLDYPHLFPFSYRKKNNLLFKYAARNSDLICTVSEYSKGRIAEHYKIIEDDILVTPNASFKYVEPLNSLKEKIILYVSRIEPRKNHLMLIKAFVDLKLHLKGYKLYLVGSRALKYNEVDVYIESLTIDERKAIIFKEGISDIALNNLYGQSELFVFPSIAEGFGIPPIEAAMKGTKVICADTTGMSEFSFFRDRGLMFNPYSIDDLKEKIVQILSFNSYPYSELIEDISNIYSWDKVADVFVTKINNKIKNYEK